MCKSFRRSLLRVQREFRGFQNLPQRLFTDIASDIPRSGQGWTTLNGSIGFNSYRVYTCLTSFPDRVGSLLAPQIALKGAVVADVVSWVKE
jgi:hypothetical protein